MSIEIVKCDIIGAAGDWHDEGAVLRTEAVVEDEPDDFFIAKGLPEPDDSQPFRELLDRMDVADEGLAYLLLDVGYLSFEESCWLLKNKSIGFNDLIYLYTLLLINQTTKNR